MKHTSRQIFYGMKVLIGQKWVEGEAVVVEGSKIHAIIPANMIKHHLPAERHEYSNEHYLIPGLIDLHIHGAHGKDVMDASSDSLAGISEALVREGVTGYLATTMTADDAVLEAVLSSIKAYGAGKVGAAVLGVNLEGPFISKMGVHPKEKAKKPDPKKILEWQVQSGNVIRLMTFAPELPGADDLITAMNKAGIVPSIGHTNATYDEACRAIKDGCLHATHLYNAMSGLHHREPGTVGAILLGEHVSAELIVDGLHIAPAIIELTYRIKGKDKLVLVTDAMCAKLIGDGEFKLGEVKVIVKEGKATLPDGTLAGSTLTMLQAIKNMMHFSGCSLEEAIFMATYNPARTIGMLQNKGTIEVGKDADLVVLDPTLEVSMTMREGGVAYCL